MSRPTVLAYYFPNWHQDSQNAERYGHGWNEWQLLKDARPRFARHRQPRVPALGYVDESDSEVMAVEIDLAADHGIDVFVFDFFHGGAGWAAFPSGHTTLITAPLAVLWFAAPRWRWALPIPFLAVVVGLLGADYHWLADIIAGFFVGTASGIGAVALLRARS